MDTPNHFADLIDARDGVHPNRGNWVPETDHPDEEFLEIDAEDTFGMLVEEGHGIRVHKTDRPWMGKLDLNSDNCPHRMITFQELCEDCWDWQLEHPEDELTPLEAGPWEDLTIDHYGDEMEIGFLIGLHDDEYVDETVDILAQTHREEQNQMSGLGRAVENSLRVSVLSEEKERREERFKKILVWCLTVDFKKLQSHKGRLWQKVNKSRKMCGDNELWGFVYLTKEQVNAINKVIKARVEKYQEKFRRK